MMSGQKNHQQGDHSFPSISNYFTFAILACLFTNVNINAPIMPHILYFKPQK